MLSERRIVSRKTAKDGKLEISAEGGRHLLQSAPEQEAALDVTLDGERGRATVMAMPCGCRGAGDAHVHYFLQSDLFKVLPAESEVHVEGPTAHAAVEVRRL